MGNAIRLLHGQRGKRLNEAAAVAVYADGEWVESDLLLSDKVGGRARRGPSQKVQTYKFAQGAGVQLY